MATTTTAHPMATTTTAHPMTTTTTAHPMTTNTMAHPMTTTTTAHPMTTTTGAHPMTTTAHPITCNESSWGEGDDKWTWTDCNHSNADGTEHHSRGECKGINGAVSTYSSSSDA